MFSEMNFAEWIAENHYRLYNVEDGVNYWKNEDGLKTTAELFDMYRQEKRVNI